MQVDLHWSSECLSLNYKNRPFGYIAFSKYSDQPAIGGIRICYESIDNNAPAYCIGLANTMQKKAKAADPPLGGAKAILYVESIEKKHIFLNQFSKVLNKLRGKYITAVDIGSTEADMNFLHQLTPFVTGHTIAGGEPSAYTAKTVLLGVQAACKLIYNEHSMQGKHILIQGLGKVGINLLTQLRDADNDIKITICDIDQKKALQYAQQYNAIMIDYLDCYQTPCDIFIAAATSYLIGLPETKQMYCRIFAAAANNPFKNPEAEQQLIDRQTLVLPDYLINTGGLIYCAYQYGVITQLEQRIKQTYDRVLAFNADK